MIIKRVRNTTVIRTMSTVMMTSITAATFVNQNEFNKMSNISQVKFLRLD